MTTEIPDTHDSAPGSGPLALSSSDVLGPNSQAAPRFARTYCAQCGAEFGPGNSGFSHCKDHAPITNLMTTTEVLAEVVRCMRETGKPFYADQVQAAALTLSDWQERCVVEGFKYWRGSDAHGVVCTKEQAENMLAAVLGVEVEIGA